MLKASIYYTKLAIGVLKKCEKSKWNRIKEKHLLWHAEITLL